MERPLARGWGWAGMRYLVVLLGIVLPLAVFPVREASAQAQEFSVRSVVFVPQPVAGIPITLRLDLASAQAARQIQVSLREFTPEGRVVSSSMGEVVESSRYRASVTFPARGLWYVEIGLPSPAGLKVVGVPVYVASALESPRSVWLDADAFERLTHPPAWARFTFSPPQWRVQGVTGEGSWRGKLLPGKVGLVTLVLKHEPTGGDATQWRALGLEQPDSLELTLKRAERGPEVRNTATSSGTWSYQAQVNVPRGGIWRVVVRPVVAGRQADILLEAGEVEAVGGERMVPSWLPYSLWGVLGLALAAFGLLVRLGRIGREG